jgi:hypothetical protein
VLIVDSLLEAYTSTEPFLGFLQQMFTLFREKPESWPLETQVKFAGQLLEYAPIQSLAHLQRWLKSYFSSQSAQSRLQLQDHWDTLAELPVMKDLISCTRTASSAIGLTNSFADSQVSRLLDYLICC